MDRSDRAGRKGSEGRLRRRQMLIAQVTTGR